MAGLGRALADLAAAIVFAIGDHRPAVVAACFGAVDLVAPLRAVLMDPRSPCGRLAPGRSLGVAVAPNSRSPAARRAAASGLPGAAPPVGRYAHDLAQVVVQALGVLLAAVALAQREKQMAVRRLHDAAAKVQLARHLGTLAEEHFHVLQRRRVRRASVALARAVLLPPPFGAGSE